MKAEPTEDKMLEQDLLEERFIKKRVLRLALLAALAVLSGVLMGMVHRRSLGDVLALVFVDILYAGILVCYLESLRLHQKGEPDCAEDYQQMCNCFAVSAAALLLVSFCPHYTAPVFAIAFLLSAGIGKERALVVVLFFNVQLALGLQASVYVMSCYLMMTFLGVMMTAVYDQKQYRRQTELITLALSAAVPLLFRYLESGTPTAWFVVVCLISGMISVIGMHFLYDSMSYSYENYDEISLNTIVDQSFHLVREMKKYSQADYSHAVRVSRVAAHCAVNIGADAKLAAVGGFYYRLGKFDGGPQIENGVRIAQNNCFPRAVVAILSEYNGMIRPISTVESAIVHIADMLVTRFEMLDQSTLSSSWNRDIVIYQALNEKSATGIYDESGLSMNQFLKIREFLAKEEELL
ncbi:MAG: hypothetical protein HFH35_00325 [Eubacterium sp.]|nr:hypothetical protein [Eubacterium sp.]